MFNYEIDEESLDKKFADEVDDDEEFEEEVDEDETDEEVDEDETAEEVDEDETAEEEEDDVINANKRNNDSISSLAKSLISLISKAIAKYIK